MKKIIYLLIAVLVLASCDKKTMTISISNQSDMAWNNDIAEVNLDELVKFEKETFLILDLAGQEVPYQITYDNKVIFPVTVKAHEVVNYQVKAGKPGEVKPMVFGKHYPERVDDIAWENDRIAFRTYGPALQASGERAFGYDIWVKRVTDLVVENRYATELNPETQAKIQELRKTDPKAAQELANSISYHNDHGNGLDYYSVGPTLGAGTSALLNANGDIVYPYCYKTYEILDNGPLRFTVKLKYNPLAVDESPKILETRLISLDAGSQLNKISITYNNLLKSKTIVTGIVLHEPSEDYVAEAASGYIAYADPAHPENGQTYIGAVFPADLNDAKAVKFSEEEKKDRKANGHVLAYSLCEPGSTYTYYAGGGWNKWGFNTSAEWFNYIKNYAAKVRQPLTITIQ